MATIEKQVQGVLNIGNVQGNYRKVDLIFEFTDMPDVTNLLDFDDIRMEIKEMHSVKMTPFLVFDLADGLVISGDDSLTLSFILDETFWQKQVKKWVYDIVFLINDKRYTLIEGKITNDLTVGSI